MNHSSCAMPSPLAHIGDVSPIYRSLCASLMAELDKDSHLVGSDCGHWTLRRLIALGDKEEEGEGEEVR